MLLVMLYRTSIGILYKIAKLQGQLNGHLAVVDGTLVGGGVLVMVISLVSGDVPPAAACRPFLHREGALTPRRNRVSPRQLASSYEFA